DFAVGDDIDAGALHIADGKQGGIVLRLLEPWFGHAPDRHAYARYRFRQQLTVHQPIRLWIAADHGGGQQWRWAGHDCSLPGAMARNARCGIEVPPVQAAAGAGMAAAPIRGVDLGWRPADCQTTMRFSSARASLS